LTIQKYFYEQAVSNCISRELKAVLQNLQPCRLADDITWRSCMKSSGIPGLWYFLQKIVLKWFLKSLSKSACSADRITIAGSDTYIRGLYFSW